MAEPNARNEQRALRDGVAEVKPTKAKKSSSKKKSSKKEEKSEKSE